VCYSPILVPYPAHSRSCTLHHSLSCHPPFFVSPPYPLLHPQPQYHRRDRGPAHLSDARWHPLRTGAAPRRVRHGLPGACVCVLDMPPPFLFSSLIFSRVRWHQRMLTGQGSRHIPAHLCLPYGVGVLLHPYMRGAGGRGGGLPLLKRKTVAKHLTLSPPQTNTHYTHTHTHTLPGTRQGHQDGALRQVNGLRPRRACRGRRPRLLPRPPRPVSSPFSLGSAPPPLLLFYSLLLPSTLSYSPTLPFSPLLPPLALPSSAWCLVPTHAYSLTRCLPRPPPPPPTHAPPLYQLP
jgi:hypothetical protein